MSRAAAIAALAALAAGCGTAAAGGGAYTGAATTTTSGEATTTTAPASAPDTLVEVGLTDYRFDGLPGSVEGPHVRFEAVNQGPSDHELEVLDESGEPRAEIEAMPPGESASLDIELEPGTYTIQCLVPVGDDTDDSHADRGMLAELVVE